MTMMKKKRLIVFLRVVARLLFLAKQESTSRIKSHRPMASWILLFTKQESTSRSKNHRALKLMLSESKRPFSVYRHSYESYLFLIN
mmetsp:Transcript_15165/g.32113  ORF Transcript_15165/g.32113 Transcript_15165/m.32113 type:complete len:86 (-) Transcript_15165:75-332(-)